MPVPARDARDKCARCGHVWTFHQKREGATCKAVGCHVKGSEPGERCTGFVGAVAQPSRRSSKSA